MHKFWIKNWRKKLYISFCLFVDHLDEFKTFLGNLELNFYHMTEKNCMGWLFMVILMQNQTHGMLMVI